MSVPSPAIIQTMQRASALLQSGNFVLARSTLLQVVQASPRFVEAYRLLAGAQQALGDEMGAERSLRTAVDIEPAWQPAQTALGELLAGQGRLEEAERALRRALSGKGAYARASHALARLLNAQGRYGETVELTAQLETANSPDVDLAQLRAMALIALHRQDEALSMLRRIAQKAATNPQAELNLAGALDSAGLHLEAEQAARKAIKKGAQTAEAYYQHARALLSMDRFEEADTALREALHRRPDFADAQTNLAQLIWMRSGDVAAATEVLDRALQQFPDADDLHKIKCTLLDVSGDPAAAYAWVGERIQRSSHVPLLLTASQAASKFDAHLALEPARRATRLSPDGLSENRALVDALLGIGAADEALAIVERLLPRWPNDQYLLGAQATAWRMLGDARYAQRCDYAQMARAHTLDTPPGWNDLTAYLGDLRVSLHKLHRLHTHPLYQSLRHGSQTAQDLRQVDDAAIQAFFVAIDGPIRRHMQAIGQGEDPLRRRNNGSYRIKGIWSVKLRSQGYHTNHVHPEGWLSSACYIELPDSVRNSPENPAGNDAADRPGWLKFGEPGYPTTPPLAPEYFIRPEPGRLALFPSYFWHGTVPFDGNDTRLTIAFDLVPG